MKKQTNPVVHSAHRKEWQSKVDFEKLIQSIGMFLPGSWNQKDYGIDANVEITRPAGAQDSVISAGQFFLLQLKSSDTVKKGRGMLSFSVPTQKIVYWLSCNLPVMFVVNDLTDGTFYYRWINNELTNELGKKSPVWMNQQTVSISIPFTAVLNKSSQGAVWDYVISWKAPATIPLLPGVYFETKEQCVGWFARLQVLTDEFGFDSVRNNLKALSRKLDDAIYKVALTGPSRVGKSTMINALLKRKGISPTDIYQTTGVPIQVFSAREECIIVYFKDGRKERFALSNEVIKSFATQQQNEGNRKDVTLVTVFLRNSQLEKGVSYIDIPGLDDADEHVYNYAWTTVTDANAILYLVDASSFENGGYVFKREYKEHIMSLGQSLDRIFLVFNKVNALTGNKRPLLEARVIQDLKKYDLYEKVAQKIYFVSAEEAATLTELEHDIWRFILGDNKNGLAQLHSVAGELEKCLLQFNHLIGVRLLNEENRSKLLGAVQILHHKMPGLEESFIMQKTLLQNFANLTLQNSLHHNIAHLKSYLEAIPAEEPLPDHSVIKQMLMRFCHESIVELNYLLAQELSRIKTDMDHWMDEHLKEVNTIISGSNNQKIVNLSDLELFQPLPDDIAISLRKGFVTGLFTSIFFPPAALIAGFVAFLGDLILSAEDRRAKKISQIIDHASTIMAKQYNRTSVVGHEVILEACEVITAHVNNNINVYMSDIQHQLNDIPEQAPDEQHRLENAQQTIPEYQNGLILLVNHISRLAGK